LIETEQQRRWWFATILSSVQAGQDRGATFLTESDGCREKIQPRKHSYARWLRRVEQSEGGRTMERIQNE